MVDLKHWAPNESIRSVQVDHSRDEAASPSHFHRAMPAALPRLRDHLFDPSGGLVYQWRALRHRRRLWAPFHREVASWLEAWQPQREELVIVGPNAGHALPAGFFSRFERVVALEPDPLARWLLARRGDAGRLLAGQLDCLATADGLAALAASYPQAAILFSNVLGQVAAPAEDWATLIARHLPGHAWASYHDVVSTAQRPQRSAGCTVDQAESLAATLQRFWQAREISVVDHETFRLGRTGPHRYAPWQITPGRWQLVEWTAHAAGGEP